MGSTMFMNATLLQRLRPTAHRQNSLRKNETLESAGELALKNYRNPLGHTREMDIVPRKQGDVTDSANRGYCAAPEDARTPARC